VSMPEQTHATLSWESGRRFQARSESGHVVPIDSASRPGHTAAGPMELLLIAIAGCTAIDVVAILEKMRQPLAGLDVEITGDRAEQHPKRLTAISITYRLRGGGLSREKVERAVELSHSTFCSAVASLRPDCPVTTTIDIEEG
jgi:putative redox protein